MYTVCWWSGGSVPNQGGPTVAPRSSAQILSDLGPDSKSQEDKNNIHWKELTKKLSKLECFLALIRVYTVAEYLTTVTDPNLRKALSMYRLSEHSLAIEKGRHRQTWLSREDRLCAHCPQNDVETELHFHWQPVKNKHHCKYNPYLCWFIFPFVL